MKKKNIIILSVIFIIIIIIIIIVLKKRKQNNQIQDEIDNLTNPENNNNKNYDNISFPLKKGQKGDVILWLQKALNKLHNSNLVTDGIFGNETEKIVKQFYGTTEINEWLLISINSELSKLK